jgi:hypothetical protein
VALSGGDKINTVTRNAAFDIAPPRTVVLRAAQQSASAQRIRKIRARGEWKKTRRAEVTAHIVAGR